MHMLKTIMEAIISALRSVDPYEMCKACGALVHIILHFRIMLSSK